MGGTITVSRHYQGSTFTFRIPAIASMRRAKRGRSRKRDRATAQLQYFW
jgi:hypothetical protein